MQRRRFAHAIAIRYQSERGLGQTLLVEELVRVLPTSMRESRVALVYSHL